MKLKSIYKISGEIVVDTGLHIGGASNTMEIGGMDNPIIRNPATGEPYIPGSSLKGKMRSLYELTEIDFGINGNCHSCSDPKCKICTVFGSANGENKTSGPTRLIVRDAFLSQEDKKAFFNNPVIVEEKWENSIDRINAKANPRSMERVIPGVKFDFDFVFRVFSGDSDTLLDDVVIRSMKLLEDDFLGGGGSRGNGKVHFEDVSVEMYDAQSGKVSEVKKVRDDFKKNNG